MKASINLYLDEFKPKADPLSLKVVVYAWLTSLVVMGALYLFTGYDLQLKTELEATLSSALEAQKVESEQLKEQALSHGFDPVLVKKAEILENEIKNKRMLVRAISGSDTLNAKGYAALMYDLAHYAHQDVWLTTVKYTPDDILIRGGTRTPEALPKWINAISQSSYFNGKPLNKLTMSVNGDKTYTLFEVATSQSSSLQSAAERGVR